MTTLGSTTFVGRTDDLDRLVRVWRQARSGERRVVLVGGEAGIGKTHLATALARAVHADGGAVLYGSCDEGLQVPYQPFATALGQAVDDATDAGGVPLLGRHPEELGRLVPWLADRVPQLRPPAADDSDTDQHRMFDGVADWLRSITGVVPLLFVLDDLHWATRPTLNLLRHVIDVVDPAPLMVVAAYRDTESGRRRSLDELLADMYRRPDVERLTLGGLSADDVVDLLQAATGRPLAPSARAVARAVHAETGGNPFFARQFLRHLIDNGTLVTDEQARWTVVEVSEPLGVPEGVREVMARRLGRLSEQTLAALEVSAVIGNEFELQILTSVMEADGVDEDSVLTGLEEAVEARLLTEIAPFRFRFAHALVRTSILGGVAQARLARLHRRVAAAIETVHAGRLDEHFTELARHHVDAASPSDTGRAVTYAVRAGQAASDRLAHRGSRGLVPTGGRADRPPVRRARHPSGPGSGCCWVGPSARQGTRPTGRRCSMRDGWRWTPATRAWPHAAALANRRVLLGPVLRPDRERLAQIQAAIDLLAGRDGPELARLLAQLGSELKASGEPAARGAERRGHGHGPAHRRPADSGRCLGPPVRDH